MGGLQSWSGRCEGEKNFTPAEENEREKGKLNMQDGITHAAFELIRLNGIRNEKENRIEIRESVVDEFGSGTKDQREIDVNENNTF
jgi:hypothetical protein